MTELMQEYLSQATGSVYETHTDQHSDQDSYYGNGDHTEYDNHTDEDEDYDGDYD
jgi:hypothetical protein